MASTPECSSNYCYSKQHDAAFKKATRKPKPSDLLLHYNYGAAAVKCWGRGTDLLRERARPPRPLVPFLVPTHSMDAAIRNLRAGTGRLVESEGQAEWDEDDVMLFLWGNSPAAKERHLKKVDENNRRMEPVEGRRASLTVLYVVNGGRRTLGAYAKLRSTSLGHVLRSHSPWSPGPVTVAFGLLALLFPLIDPHALSCSSPIT